MDFYKKTHDNPNLRTLGDFLDQNGISIAINYLNRPEEFLKIKGGTDLTNRERIFEKYLDDEQRNKNQFALASELEIEVGTVFYIPFSELSVDSVTASLPGLRTISNLGSYIAPNLEKLISNTRYKREFRNKRGSVSFELTDLTVVLWCRSLSNQDIKTEQQGDFINISPFVSKIDTTVDKKNGGRWQLTLPPVIGRGEDGTWSVQKNNALGYLKGETLNYSNFRKNSQIGIGDRETYFFEYAIQPNDVIFIAFEKLPFDRQIKGFNISGHQLYSNNWDMIGLVDMVNTNYRAEGTNVEINVRGRDLMKTLIEDGCYFYPEAFGMESIFARNQDSPRLLQRVYGELKVLAAYTYRKISDSIAFIFNQLQNTGYVPDSVFDAWGNDREKRLIPNKDEITFYRKRLVDNKESCFVSIKLSRKESGFEEDPELESLTFSTLSSLILSGAIQSQGMLTQAARSALEGLLYDGKKISINVLKNDPSQAATAINTAIIYFGEKNKPPKSVVLEKASGVWQIIQVLQEETVSGRLIVDSSISTSTGSIINFINKLCQDPFVEFFGDTYGNKYSMMVRKCPYDRKGYKDLIDTTVNEENGTGVIASSDVISETLSFDDSDIYTWYILRPKGHLMGAEKYSIAYLPAIYLGEYVDIWGSRPLDMTTNYYPLLSKQEKSEGERAFDFEKSIFQELKFLIDCNSYLPFSRKGSLVLYGDRRIKVGTAIWYQPTDEYYQVDSVVQSFTRNGSLNERVTTVNVSRGLRRLHFDKYFKVFNTVFDQNSILKKRDDQKVFNKNVVENWKVDKELFNFFIKRGQFL